MATRRGTNGKDRLIGTSAADRIFGLNGNDILFGGRGNDQIFGGGGNDTLNGDAGNDTLDGGTGIDSMAGGAGNDTFIVDNALDKATDTAGVDTVLSNVSYTLGSGIEVLTLTATGNLNGTGNALANTLNGTSGDNVLDGGAGADVMNGGAGGDTYMVDSAGDTITDTFGTDTVISSVSYTLGAGLENLGLVGSANIDGTGNAGVNTIEGNTGDNVLDGQGGADTMIGGAGNDTFIVDDAGDTVGDLSGIDTVRASVSYTLGGTLEHLILTGAGHINGTGNALANTLTGNDGANTLNGMGGADTMAGGLGDDIYVVNLSTDVVIEEIGGGVDEVQVTGPFYQLALGSEIERLVYTGVGNFTGVGNEFANTIIGGSGADTLLGGVGDDTLIGGVGADGLDGGHGGDTYVFADNDVASGEVIADSGLAGLDALRLADAATFVDFTGAGTITGIEQLRFFGNQIAHFRADQFGAGQIDPALNVFAGFHNNILRFLDVSAFDGSALNFVDWSPADTIEIIGTTGADTIVGTTENDTIRGGVGVDSVDGGEGDDNYVFQNGHLVAGETIADSGSSTADTIATFAATLDFTTATISGIERLFVSAADVTFNASQLPANLAISTGGGTNTVTLKNASGFDGSGFTFTSWNNGVDTFALEGTAGADSIVGTSRSDTLYGGAGADVLDGGEGEDVYVFRHHTEIDPGDNVADSGTTGIDRVRVAEGGGIAFLLMSLSGIEGVDLIDAGSTALFHSSQLTNTFAVSSGDNDQRLQVRVTTPAFSAANWTFSNWAVTDDFSIIIHNNSGATVTGSTIDDTIYDGFGSDVMFGGDGNDTLNATLVSSTNDELYGGQGSDVYRVNFNVGDIISDTGSTLDTDVLEPLGGPITNNPTVQISGIETVRFINNGQSWGIAQSSWVVPANLELVGVNGPGINVFAYYELSSYDATGWTFVDWTNNSLVGLNGTGGSDSITGTTRRDNLSGNGGGDTLRGGIGVDTYFGGAGADHFRFLTGDGGVGAGNRDIISDFVQGTDLIDLQGMGANFIGNAGFSGLGSAEVRFTDDGVHTFVEIDEDGDGALDAEQEIQLSNVLVTLTGADFVL